MRGIDRRPIGLPADQGEPFAFPQPPPSACSSVSVVLSPWFYRRFLLPLECQRGAKIACSQIGGEQSGWAAVTPSRRLCVAIANQPRDRFWGRLEIAKAIDLVMEIARLYE